MARARRWMVPLIAGLSVAGAQPAPAQDAPPPTDPVPTTVVPAPSVPTTTAPGAGAAPLIPVPAGCVGPSPAQVVFIGELVAKDFRTGRFEIETVRAGSAAAWRLDDLIDVRYGPDVRFLEVGDRYLVGARADEATGALSSKVRQTAPLFGGNEVVGVNDNDLDCPSFEDSVRTLLPDGGTVDSGIISPLKSADRRLLGAIVLPIGVAFAIVIALAMLRWALTGLGHGLGALGRAAVTPYDVRHAHRHRRHQPVERADEPVLDAN